MNQVTNNNQAANGANPLGSPNPSPASGGPLKGDKALFYAMVALSDELGTLANAETSTAKLSDALYKNMVPNSTNELERMQQELADCSWVQEHFSAFASYFTKGGTQPPLGPGMSAGDLAVMKDFYQKHPKLSDARIAVQAQAQEISQQNTFVQEAKVIPQGLENNTKALADAQTQDSMMIAPFMQLVRSLYNRPL